MIKKKLCQRCLEIKPIWKNSSGKRYCNHCWKLESTVKGGKPTKVKQQKPLAPRSSKRIIQDKEYSSKRKVFLEKHPMCIAHLPGVCTNHSTDVHHIAGRIESLYLDEESWLAVCRACHSWIHTHPLESRELKLFK